jgi:hypothetical protein
MPNANDIYGTAFKNGSAVLMARIVDSDGENIEQASVSAIEYSVYELDPCRPDNLTVVTGHDGVTLDVSDVVFDTLQTGGLWTVDETGYNFRHEIDVTGSEAFPKAGTHYQVRYEITPVGGQKTIVRFQLRVI